MIRTILKEPLLHFLLLGVLIFFVYGQLNPADGPVDQVVVSSGQQAHLVTTFSRTWNRPPTEAELESLIDDWIREEIAYREAQAMELDRNDTIIRRRLRQKLELLAEDLVLSREPEDEELNAYLTANQSDYIREARYTLEQLYFSPDRHGDQVRSLAERALAQLRESGVEPASETKLVGDAIPLPQRLEDERVSAISRQFGAEFTQSLEHLEPGQWHGPIRSGFGLHLVFLHGVEAQQDLDLDAARPAVLRDWSNEQRRQAVDALYDQLMKRYTIEIFPMSAESGAAAPNDQ